MPIYNPPQAVAQPIRIMRETGVNDTMHADDGGLIVTAAGITVTLESYSDGQRGQPYALKNASEGNITVVTASGESIKQAGGNITSQTIPANFAVQFIRNGSNCSCWIEQ